MALLKNFVPTTGRGCFDFEYDGGDFCTITVKVYPIYENVYSQKLKWDESAKHKFVLSAEMAIANIWSKANHRIVNRYLNPMKTVRPHFFVRFTTSKDAASVIMNVPRYASAYGPGNLAICNSYVGLQQIDSGNPLAQSTAMVHSETTRAVDIKALEGPAVTRDERDRVRTLIEAFGLATIPVGDEIARSLEVKLANFVNKVSLGTPSRPMIPIVLSLPLAATQKDEMFRDRLKLKIEAFHIKNPVLLERNSKVGADKVAMTLGANDGDDFNAELWLEIFAHEYGHMIGLPDEYDNAPSRDYKKSKDTHKSKDIAISRFLDMTEAYGVAPPDMGKMTTSLMCKGGDILRCHMITVLEAMQRITGNDRWVIA